MALDLYKGNLEVDSRTSPNSLYDEGIATMEGGGQYNQTDADGRWIVTSSLTRDQSLNLADARAKVAQIIAEALKAPIPRRPTRPTHGSKLRRVSAKKITGARKQDRGNKNWD